MKRASVMHLVLAAGLMGLAACEKSTAPASLVDEALVTADVAQSAGDAIANDVAILIGNEVNAALPAAGISFDLFGVRADSLSTTRTRTCYDGADAVVANCGPATTRRIVFHVSVFGTRSGTNFTAVVRRVRDWTVTRNFDTAVQPAEVSRTHDGVGTSADTTTHTNPTTAITRTHAESSTDSTIAVTFNLPRASNPWPVSGMMVKRVSIHSTFQGPNRTDSRDFQKRVEVDFPADAQGNVVMKVNEKTCNLNLVTHAVTNCQ
jgi:hypothetical protein